MLYKTYKQHNYDFENTDAVYSNSIEKNSVLSTGKIICSQKVV